MTRPAFSAPLYAWLRQGTKEAAQALHAFPDSVRHVEEIGMMGNPTQHMVTQQVRGQDFQSVLQNYAARGAPAKEQQQEQQPER
jgi:hypothetical protein